MKMVTDKEVWEGQYLRKGEVWRGRSELPFTAQAGRTLELGCGNGKTASALIAEGARLICLDLSSNALVECERTIGRGRADLVEGDVIDLPFIDGTFEAVVCYHVLEHLLEEDRRKASREIVRVLSKNGSLYVQAFSRKDMRYGKGTNVERDTFVRKDGVRYHYFTEDEIAGLFEGLEVRTARERKLDKRYHGTPMSRVMVQMELIKR